MLKINQKPYFSLNPHVTDAFTFNTELKYFEELSSKMNRWIMIIAFFPTLTPEKAAEFMFIVFQKLVPLDF